MRRINAVENVKNDNKIFALITIENIFVFINIKYYENIERS